MAEDELKPEGEDTPEGAQPETPEVAGEGSPEEPEDVPEAPLEA